MLPKVEVTDVRKMGIKTKWVPPTEKEIGGLITTITIEAAVRPDAIGDLAKIVRDADAATVVLGSRQYIMSFDESKAEPVSDAYAPLADRELEAEAEAAVKAAELEEAHLVPYHTMDQPNRPPRKHIDTETGEISEEVA